MGNKKSFDRLAKTLELLKITGQKKRATQELIAQEILNVVKRSFEREQSPDGEKWKTLDFNYKKWKIKKVGSRKILEFNGRLQNSFQVEILADSLRVYSECSVAAVHQFGLKGQAKREFIGIDSEFPKNLRANLKILWSQ